MRPEQQDLLRRNAQELGAELERRPAERIVITGFAQRTPLGDTWETWDGLLEGRSGAQTLNYGNGAVDIGAPMVFNSKEIEKGKKVLKNGITNIGKLVVDVTDDAMRMAGLVDDNGKLIHGVNPDLFGNFVSTGFGSSYHIIDVAQKYYRPDEDGNVNYEKNLRKISPFDGVRSFSEQTPASASIAFELQGWPQNSSEACATGLSSLADAVESVKSGRNQIAVAGGAEDSFTEFGDVSVAMFAAMKNDVLSKRNDDPEHASRPFDKDRDGFVLASGGGAIIVENLESALRRGAPIFAEVIGFGKAGDGNTRTGMRHDRVAKLIHSVMYNSREQEYYDVDSIFAHATSTPEGDINEATALRLAFGEMLNDIPITAPKGQLGHLAGGSGAVGAIAAIQALMFGQIPPVGNLENVDPQEITAKRGETTETFTLEDLNLIKGQSIERQIQTALVLGYGFGGYNAAVLLRRWNG